MRIFYIVVSALTHPVFLTTILTATYFFYTEGMDHTYSPRETYPIVVLNTLILPIITVLILKGLGWLDSFYMRSQKERILPLIANMIFYFWAYYVSRNSPFDVPLQILLLSSFLSLIGLVLLGISMKPSLHMSGWSIASFWLGGLVVVKYAFFMFPFIVVLILSVLVYIARYNSKAHTHKELIGGILNGAASLALAIILSQVF